MFAMSLCIDLFILQSKVTPNILIDLLCGITSVPTVSVMCLKGSGFVLNTVKSVLSWLISRELFLIHSHTSVAFDSIVAVIISKTLKVYFYVPLRECPSATQSFLLKESLCQQRGLNVAPLGYNGLSQPLRQQDTYSHILNGIVVNAPSLKFDSIVAVIISKTLKVYMNLQSNLIQCQCGKSMSTLYNDQSFQ